MIMVDVLLEYINLQSYFQSSTTRIMLALCLMLLATYYAHNYAGIIGWSLAISQYEFKFLCELGWFLQRQPVTSSYI